MQQAIEMLPPLAEHDQQPVRLPARGSPLGSPHSAFPGDPVARVRGGQTPEVVSRLAAGLAHEVNHQLALMLHRTRVLLQRGSAGASRSELEELNRTAEHMDRLLRQMRTLDHGELPARRPADLHALVTQTVGAFAVELDADRSVVTELGAVRPWVLADAGQVEQILLNLLFNARDALAGSGTITVRTANVELSASGRNHMMPCPPGPYVQLSVRDTGCGMDRATQARIFEPYFTTKPRGQGSGLGLAIVWEIVCEHGGTLHVASAPGQGTVFSVYLPLAREDRHAPVAPGRAAPRPGSKTVLVVEDEDSVRSLLRELLRRQGYTVLEACDGREALQVAGRHAGPIHLLISDCLLPHLSGAELAGRLRPCYTDLRVLYVSGYPAAEAAEVAGIDPSVPFLQKPFSAAALADQVRELLDY
jgi:signal transduction histidine kinase/CheY-like chemotaxis protein